MDLAGYFTKYRDGIVGKLAAERIGSLSDAEIDRALGPCVCGDFLTACTKHARDAGSLQFSEVAKIIASTV
jgi:hypothetical protein